MYILFAGAPGSKWSSVVKNIYWSDDIDHSDYSDDRRYFHDADTPGQKHLMHIGAYWDPGMEFENTDWDGPFTGEGRRIIKSHTFALELDELKNKGYPIVLVGRRPAYKMLDWWMKCGGFSITYPKYDYYGNKNVMWTHIKKQNNAIYKFKNENIKRIIEIKDNRQLCKTLEISLPKVFKEHNYKDKDIEVYVYK